MFFKKISFLFVIISFVYTSSCSNPIAKKKKEMKNLKITLGRVVIKKYNMILIPPVPKIYFDVFINVHNQNEEPVKIEKFDFKIFTNYSNRENVSIAFAKSPVEYNFLADEQKELPLTLVTTLEDNADQKIYGFVGEILKKLITNDEMEFLLDGTVEYDTFLGKLNIPVKEVFKTKVRP